jgi:hypothetical protein
LDEQFIEIGLGLRKLKLWDNAAENDLVVFGGKGHLTAEEGLEMA